MLTVDARELKKLMYNIKNASEIHRKASAEVLSRMAANGRRNSIKNIKATTEVRNSRFVNGSLRYDQANQSQSTNRQRSEFGSIVRPRFTGWEEQETGKRPKKDRVMTLAARGGTYSMVSLKYARLRGRLLTPKKLKVKTPKTQRGNTLAMFAIMRRRNLQKGAIVQSGSGFKPGVYIQDSDKIKRAQTFNQYQRVRRTKWLSKARSEVLRRTDISRQYYRNVVKIINKGIK